MSHRPQRIGPSAATAIETRIQSPFTRPVMPLLNALQSVQGGGPGFTVILTAAWVVSVPTAILFMLTQRFFQRGLALGQY